MLFEPAEVSHGLGCDQRRTAGSQLPGVLEELPV